MRSCWEWLVGAYGRITDIESRRSDNDVLDKPFHVSELLAAMDLTAKRFQS